MSQRYKYNSLEDFVVSTPLTVDGQLDDGWGAHFPVRGCEIEATILFCDISNFSGRTFHLTPAQTLIFVNNFFSWITAEAMRENNGIVDKYIGDEVMVVFSKNFGCADPLVEALQVSRWMAERDALSFCPHIGIASGQVIVGYVGTPIKYNCSVFGSPVALAARCAAVRPLREYGMIGSSIVLPAEEWSGQNLADVFPPRRYQMPDGTVQEQPSAWRLVAAREVPMKNLPEMRIQEIVKQSIHIPGQSAEGRAIEGLEALREAGRYWS